MKLNKNHASHNHLLTYNALSMFERLTDITPVHVMCLLNETTADLRSDSNHLKHIDDLFLPLRLPGFLFKPIVNRLRDGRFHQVDVPHDLRSKNIPYVTVKFAEAQTL